MRVKWVVSIIAASRHGLSTERRCELIGVSYGEMFIQSVHEHHHAHCAAWHPMNAMVNAKSHKESYGMI